MMEKFEIDENDDLLGKRIDKFLSIQFPDFSRVKIQDHIKTGKVLLNGNTVKSSHRLQKGDIIELKEIVKEKIEILPEEIDLKIVYESDHCLVINKPSGMVVHVGEGGLHSTGTVVNAILSKIKSNEFEDMTRPGIVHRLDKETSGLLLIAKTNKASSFFISQFKNREVKKYYKALINGEMEYKNGVVDSPIGRNPMQRKKMSVLPNGGKEAITEYEVIEGFQVNEKTYVSLLNIEIKTGRTHQIRVHMSALGYPVVGDRVYGGRRVNKLFAEKYGLERQFLQAYRLEFIDMNEKKVELEVELDEDLKKIIDQF